MKLKTTLYLILQQMVAAGWEGKASVIVWGFGQ
jgi:hypothetical protein